jgi:glutamate 5-kinase
MASKIAAARIVTESGAHCIIASGRDDAVLERICAGEPVGTLFHPAGSTMTAKKRWLGWSADVQGTLVVDPGAREAVVHRGSSLLGSGDVVSLATVGDGVFARGLVNYAADELRRIVGLKTDRIAEVLGCCPYEEVVHRDNLAVIRRDAAGDPARSPGNDPC